MNTDSPSELATLGGGCFWCLEAIYQRLPGVSRVIPGYAGGSLADPTYEAVCSGTTGHAEVVQIHFDPAIVSYRQLLDLFWQAHDPTTLNRQGNDVGTQYRSVIFTHDEQQAAAAAASLAAAAPLFSDKIVTEIGPLDHFYPAELYHWDYYRRTPQNPYCAIVIAPKLRKLGLPH